MYIYQTEEYISKSGNKFKVELSYDECCGEPWEENDGHGSVSEWTNRSKKSGELILCQDRDMKRYYDFKGAVATARVDGWGAIIEGDTPGQRAYKAAMRDYNYLRDYCRQEWWYSTVRVVLLNEADEEIEGREEYLGGVECGYGKYDNYYMDIVQSLAGEIEYAINVENEQRHTTRCVPCLVC